MDPWLATGSWLRCALHAHTTGSDGELRPTALARHYERAGFDVLAITDHWRITERLRATRCSSMPSVELNCILPGARDGHVLAFGVRADAGGAGELGARVRRPRAHRATGSRRTAASPTSRTPTGPA